MKDLLQNVLKEYHIKSNKIVDITVEKLVDNARIYELSKSIKHLKLQILQIFTMHKEKEEFKDSYFTIPNANIKKEYSYRFDLSLHPSIIIKEIKNLDSVGLKYDAENLCIYGIPTHANTIEIQIVFFSRNDENVHEDIKSIPFIVNADPKDLWLNKPSPRDSRFPKEDEAIFSSSFLDKKIAIASKRGRSHAHSGTFRDDDFLVKNLPDGWAVIAVADGAGSAKFSRAGSWFSTKFIAESFDDNILLENLSETVKNYFLPEFSEVKQPVENVSPEIIDNTETDEIQNETKRKNKSDIINSLYRNVRKLHEELNTFALAEDLTIKDLHTTLIFTLIKKFEFGYVILSFGVGDCPINVIEENGNVKLLNYLDVGETSGATRFITMQEIFNNQGVMVERFGISCFKDFSKMFLMTDGIYDPKFVVESKLENAETWKHFLRDLNGENEDQAKVDFVEDADIEKQLSVWMDFWSKGNHDDRTLVVIY